MKAKHQPCSCGCGELADECTTGRNPLGAFTIDPSVVKIFGVDDDDVDWAAYGREAFLQNWRKRAERAEAQVQRLGAEIAAMCDGRA